MSPFQKQENQSSSGRIHRFQSGRGAAMTFGSDTFPCAEGEQTVAFVLFCFFVCLIVCFFTIQRSLFVVLVFLLFVLSTKSAPLIHEGGVNTTIRPPARQQKLQSLFFIRNVAFLFHFIFLRFLQPCFKGAGGFKGKWLWRRPCGWTQVRSVCSIVFNPVDTIVSTFLFLSFFFVIWSSVTTAPAVSGLRDPHSMLMN